MKTKKRMRYLALFIAAVVAFTMLPTNVLEVKAGSDICTCGHPYDKHSSGLTCMITGCSCKGFSPSSSSSSSSTSTVTTTVASEESSEPTMSYEDYKRKVEEEAIEKRKKLFELNSKVYSNGQEIKSTLPGAYEAESVKGIAVVTPKEELERGLGLSSGEYVTVETWDVNKRKSANAAASLEYAAGSIGGEIGPMFQINMNLMLRRIRRLIRLNPMMGSADVTVGLPDGYNTDGSDISVAHVIEGGTVEYLKDKDNDPNTVTFEASLGEGAYGLVKGGRINEFNQFSSMRRFLEEKKNSTNPDSFEKGSPESAYFAIKEMWESKPSGYSSYEEYEKQTNLIFQKYGFNNYKEAQNVLDNFTSTFRTLQRIH